METDPRIRRRPRKTLRLSLALSEEDRAAIKSAADRHGMPVSEFLRAAALICCEKPMASWTATFGANATGVAVPGNTTR